jgi:hypothetical protein
MESSRSKQAPEWERDYIGLKNQDSSYVHITCPHLSEKFAPPKSSKKEVSLADSQIQNIIMALGGEVQTIVDREMNGYSISLKNQVDRNLNNMESRLLKKINKMAVDIEALQSQGGQFGTEQYQVDNGEVREL